MAVLSPFFLVQIRVSIDLVSIMPSYVAVVHHTISIVKLFSSQIGQNCDLGWF